jgi:flagellar hook-associated protein 2
VANSTSGVFSGNSRYSTDFQAVIDRATAIASLPMGQLQNQMARLSDQTLALSGLDAKFVSLQATLANIEQAAGSGSFGATVSDTDKLSASLSAGAVEGDYSIEVVDPGAFATSLSTSAWVAADGPVHDYKISLDGVEYAVTPTDNRASSVASAINSSYSDKVRAVVVNVGSNDTPDYRISLQSATLGDVHPDLLDEGISLQTQKTTGVQAQYIVNGSESTVHSATRTVNIATGVTLNLLAAGADPVTITVTRSSLALSNALANFATAYNAAVDEVDKQHGSTSSPLAGQSLVNDLSRALSRIATYSSDGDQIGSLKSLGLDLDAAGRMSFDATALVSANLSSSGGLTTFLGSGTGAGFLRTATDGLNSVERTDTGLLALAKASVTSQGSSLDDAIATQQRYIDGLKVRLNAQMAAADALVASMEQQYNFLSSMFAAQQTADKQYG